MQTHVGTVVMCLAYSYDVTLKAQLDGASL